MRRDNSSCRMRASSARCTARRSRLIRGRALAGLVGVGSWRCRLMLLGGKCFFVERLFPRGGIHFDLLLALPFKGRVGWGWCWFWFSALSREPTHVRVCFVDHPWSPVTFFCLSKRKSPKKRTPSRPRSRAHPCAR